MQKIAFALIASLSTTFVMANNDSWIETQKDSHIFIKKDNIITDKQNPDLKTTTLSINIPSMQDRKANPTKTALTNPYPISYVTEFTINCKEKTAKMGKQAIHEKFFGEGELLEESAADSNAQFTPINGADAQKMLEVVCQAK